MRIFSVCESSLPRSVRRHCDENLINVNEALRVEAQVRTQVAAREDGTATLCLTLEDGDSPLIQAAVLASSPEQAERWAGTFKENPAAFYHGVMRRIPIRR